MELTIDVKNLYCGYGDKVVLRDISLPIRAGEIVSILGPNGVGKTTFFKTLLGLLQPISGSVYLGGRDIREWNRRSFAQNIAYVPQAHTPPFPFKVLDVVTMGRVSHLGPFASPGAHDREIAISILELLGIESLACRIYTELSGGERQLVLIARALAQEPGFLVMDEPTASLDFGNQIRVLSQVNRLAAMGLGIIMTTHTPDHAYLCPGKVLLLRRGHPFIYGNAGDVVTEENLKIAYGVEVAVTNVNVGKGKSVTSCIPLLEETEAFTVVAM